MKNTYPGFTAEDFFSSDVISIPQCKGTHLHRFKTDTITFEYNTHGYRSKEFDHLGSDYLLVAGCSHTEGHGLHIEQTWATLLSHRLNLDLANIAKGCGNALFCSQNIHNWLSGRSRPRLVVVQWPNPYRFIHWQDGRAVFVLNTSNDPLFQQKVTLGETEIWNDWIRDIIVTDHVMRSHNVPVLHICLEEMDYIKSAVALLKKRNIVLHVDEKLPGNTWFFDSRAADNVHHSEWCHTKWTERILTLI